MDAISILNGVKNRVLDAKNYELLKRTYDLQNQNIEQLKTSNEGFKEDNKRLREEVKNLKTENESLTKTVAELTQKVSQLNKGSISSDLSKVALAILALYKQKDTTELRKESQIIPALSSSFSKIQIQTGIDKLEKTEMIECSSARQDRGYDPFAVDDWSESRMQYLYSLTSKGRKYLANSG